MSDTASKDLSLSSFPVEILQLITSLLPAQDVVVSLLGCGNHTLERKLKNGGVVSLFISSIRDCGRSLKTPREFLALSSVHIASRAMRQGDLMSILDCLPKSVRRLHVKAPWMVDALQSLLRTKSLATGPFGNYDAPALMISDRFPLLTYLYLGGYAEDIYLSAYEASTFYRSLPPSLTYLSVNFELHPNPNDLKALPTQLEELRMPGIDLSLYMGDSVSPVTFPSLRSVYIVHRDSLHDHGFRSPFNQAAKDAAPTSKISLAAHFPNLQRLHLNAVDIAKVDLISMPHLRALHLQSKSKKSTTSVATVFEALPRTLTALTLEYSKLLMQASDEHLPRLLSLSSLDLKDTSFIIDFDSDPLTVLLAICPNVTDLSARRQLKSGSSIPILRDTTQGLDASKIKSLSLTFSESFPSVANMPQLESLTAQCSFAETKQSFEIFSQGMVTNGLEHTWHPVYFKDLIAKLPSKVSTLKIEDLRMTDEEIGSICASLSACQRDPLAPLPSAPYDWKFDQTESLHLGWADLNLEPQFVADSSHSYRRVVMHPLQELASDTRNQASIPHVPTLLALLPRTLTALNTDLDLHTTNQDFSILFSPTAFPCLKSLTTSTLLPNMQQWTNLESLSLQRVYRNVSAPQRFDGRHPGVSPMPEGTSWAAILPPNLTHLGVPNATPASLHHLTRLTSCDMTGQAYTWPFIELPRTLTAIKGEFSIEKLLTVADFLPHIKSIDILSAALTETHLNTFYEIHGSKVQLTGGMLRQVENIEELLRRVPLPPPKMLNGDVSEYFGRVALAAYPQWSTQVKPFWSAKIDFSAAPIAAWNLFASWFSHDITSFDLSNVSLPTSFGVAMPSSTREIFVRKEALPVINEDNDDDYGYDSDDSDFDSSMEDASEEEASTSDADSDAPNNCKRLIDISLLPPSLETLAIKYHFVIRPSDFEHLPKTLTKLIVKCSTNNDFAALIKAPLPSSVTQLNIQAKKRPKMEVLKHLPASVERLSLLSNRAYSKLDTLLPHIPPTLKRLRLFGLSTQGLADSLKRCEELFPDLKIDLVDKEDIVL